MLGGIKGRPFHIVGLGAVSSVGESGALEVLGALGMVKLGELCEVPDFGDARLGSAGEIASRAEMFSVSKPEPPVAWAVVMERLTVTVALAN